MGYEVQTIDFGGLNRIGGKILVSKILLSYVFSYKPDILFVIPCRGEIPKQILSFIKSFTNTLVVAWNSDDNRRWENYSKLYASSYDYMITTYKNIYSKAQKQGFKNILLSQWACNPERNKKLDIEKKYDISFIGVAYGDRVDYIEKLIREKFNIKFGGLNWEKHFKIDKKIFFQEEIQLITNQSKIALVFSKGIDGKKQVKARVFETPAYGTCTFIEWFSGINKYYEIDKEIVIFKNKNDLVKKVRYYLKHPHKREEIAYKGRQRTLKEYTYKSRFEKLFKKLPSNKKTNIIKRVLGELLYRAFLFFLP